MTPISHALIPAGQTRRTVLRAGLVAGAAGILSACGGGSSDGQPAGSGGSSPSAGSSSATSSGDGSGGASLVKTTEVPVGSGVILKDEKIVVTQPAKGEFKAFTAICTHQQCVVNRIKGDTISCPCHGSMYSTKDGSVKGGPAPAPLKEIAVTVKNGEVVES